MSGAYLIYIFHADTFIYEYMRYLLEVIGARNEGEDPSPSGEARSRTAPHANHRGDRRLAPARHLQWRMQSVQLVSCRSLRRDALCRDQQAASCPIEFLRLGAATS
jgi:hypothetical protein